MSKLIRLAAVAGLTGTLAGLFGIIPAASAHAATLPVATVPVATVPVAVPLAMPVAVAALFTETDVTSLLADDCWGW